jgi:hypothetical protein
MSGFDQILTSYALWLFMWVAVATFAILAAIGKRSRPRVMPTIAIALTGLPIALAVSTTTVAIIAAMYQPTVFANTIAKSPLAFAAYFVETGCEFVFLSVMSVVAFIIARLRKRRLTRLPT